MKPISAAKKKKRLRDFENWLEQFKKYIEEKASLKIRYIDNAAEFLNNIYWDLLQDAVRKKIKNHSLRNIDHHKMIATTEMVIMAYPDDNSVIIRRGARKRRQLLAMLSLFIGKVILVQWNEEITSITQLKDLNFEREHLSWLENMNTGSYLIFSNASSWYLFEQLCIERIKNKRLLNSK